MRSILALSVLLVACGGSETPAPAPAPAPAKEAPKPPPEPKEDPVEKLNKEFAALDDDAKKHDWLMKQGENVYKTGGNGGIACMTCHMENGEGTKGAFPPLKGQKDHMGDCAKHAGIVINGMTGEIEVDGVKYNGVMTPQGELLSDIEIAAVLTYERNTWGNDFGDCLPEDVAKARAAGK